MQNLKNLTGELVTRENQYSFHRYLGMLPNPDRILSRTGKTIETYRELKNDPHVWSCIQSRKSGLLSLEYIIVPNESQEALVREIEAVFKDMDIMRIIRDILEAPLFGYQPFEIMWKAIGGERKMLYPEDIVAKPQEWFFYDAEGRLRFRSAGNPGGEPAPYYKIFNVQYEAAYMNPYGSALLSKCYWPVTFKNGGIRFWVNFMEKYGMPLLLGQFERGATYDETKKLAEDLASMTEDTVIVAPADLKIDMKEATRSSSVELYKELIKHCNAEISKAILSQTLTTELEMGSYAASATHFKVRKEVILSDIRLVESTFDKIIKMIIELNYGKTAAPKFNIVVNDSDNMQKVERDVKLSQAGGFRLSKNYWMQTYGFKEGDIEM